MSILRRISATISSSIDQAVGEIENHDAVIQVSMDDLRKQVAAARVRINRVKQEAQRLAERQRKNVAGVELWKQRARQSAEQNDEQRAMACLRRSHSCASEAQHQAELLEQYHNTTCTLEQEIADSESRLAALNQRHSLMRARESVTRARGAGCADSSRDIRELEDTFERWEVRLATSDSCIATETTVDQLDKAFSDSEELAALSAELAELMGEEKQS